MLIKRRTIYMIIAMSAIVFSYITVSISESEYISSTNIDKYITIHSVTYIPNGRERALCQVVGFDKTGIEYHIIDSDTHFVGDIIKYQEHHERVFIYLTTIFVLFLISVMIGMIGALVWMILNVRIV